MENGKVVRNRNFKISILSDAIPLHSSVSCLPIIYCGVGFSSAFGSKRNVRNVGFCGDYRRNCVSGYIGRINPDFVANLKSRTTNVVKIDKYEITWIKFNALLTPIELMPVSKLKVVNVNWIFFPAGTIMATMQEYLFSIFP
jgi:hypothetical protein